MYYNGPTLFTESVSAVTATNSVMLGARRIESGREYVYVYNGDTLTATAGAGVILGDSTASGASGYTISVNSALGSRCAGVVLHNDLSTHTYGWIVTKGKVNVTIGAGEGVIGASLGDGLALSTAGVFTGVIKTAGTICTGQTAKGGDCGVANTAMAEAATGQAWLFKCVL